ncbi:MAG: phage tail protein, partial [Acetobacteraceae bacterium]
MVYADGYNEANAPRIETIEFFGVTNRDQAWRETRYAMAVAQLRPDTYELTADIEHLLVTRGDLVRVTHDVPAFGVSAGRIVATESDGAGVIVGVTLDEAVGVPANAGLALRIRAAAGQSIVTPASAPPGERTAFLVPAIAGDRTAAAARNLMSNQDMAGLVAGSPGTPPDGWSVDSGIGGLVRTLSGPIIEDGIVAFDVRFAGTWTAGGTRGINTPAVSATAGQRIAAGIFVRRIAGSLAGITTRAQINTRIGSTFVGVIGDVAIAPTEAPLRQQQTHINTQFPTAGADNWRGNVQLTFPAGIPVDVTLRVGFPQGEHVTLATDQVTPFTPAVTPGDLALVGEAGRESVELLVREIRPGPDMSATLVLVDAAPAVHQAET